MKHSNNECSRDLQSENPEILLYFTIQAECPILTLLPFVDMSVYYMPGYNEFIKKRITYQAFSK